MVQQEISLPHFAQLADFLAEEITDFRARGLEESLHHLFNENSEQFDSAEEFTHVRSVIVALVKLLDTRVNDLAVIEFLPSMVMGSGEEFPALALIDDNRPFIVESAQMQLEKNSYSAMYSFNAMFVVERNAKGQLQKISSYLGQEIAQTARVESVNLYLLQNYLTEAQREELRWVMERCFADIRFAHMDWSVMTDNAVALTRDIRENARLDESQRTQESDFIAWLGDAHFTFLGMRQSHYNLDGDFSVNVDWDSSAGILRHTSYQIFGGSENIRNMLERTYAAYQDKNCSLHLFKTPFHSPVRRDVPLDALLIKRYDDQGNCIGDTLCVGLLAWAVYTEPLHHAPMARDKVRMVMEEFHAETRSYRGRELMHLMENYSRDLMFQVDIETLIEHIELMRRAHRRRECVVLEYFSQFSFSQYFSVIMPRANYSGALRETMIAYLKGYFGIDEIDYGMHLPDGAMWRVDFRLFLDAQGAQPSQEALVEVFGRLRELAKSSSDKLRLSLAQLYSPQKVSQLVQRYASSFSVDYWNRNDEVAALHDIKTLERMEQNEQEIYVRLYKAPKTWQVRLYNCSKRRVYLSAIMPILERLDLEVRTEESYDLRVARRENCGILVFTVSNAHLDEGVDLEIIENFSNCLEALFDKKTENDGFLALVLGAGLKWREIVVLRAYAKYLRQIRTNHSGKFIAETLAQYPNITRNLVRLFVARFDPDNHDLDREALVITTIHTELNNVENLDQDRLLNRYLQLILATLRTNFYQEVGTRSQREAIALKFAPREIEEMPSPVPLREIFVYSPNFEAVHLRFGFVSRGGLRWSDRQEDFRTEVLGLVKAQQVKNAVIVPMGSKGGFVLKSVMPDRQVFMTEGVKRYREFIASMLDITDSYLPNGDIRRPEQVVCHDDDDPYLVVAADKGTTTFSDYANEMSVKAKFWLGDAFASGGSVGYDHKKMGITARGAWESVKRHFREMDHNTQTTPFDVIGVGDMSGDVFGNGMLLSEHIRLIGAFNHLHIFVDPDPDPALSYQERQRLFVLSRSNWVDYDSTVLSKGGMIFERSAKILKITPEIQTKLGLSADRVTPNELIQRLLTMQSDLLWLGGIGTYIKSENENSLDVVDKANDAIRINGVEVGARVIGEGANLGVTQLGRIEYCMAGGRCNTDAIDNSAGVDCSDHEVNIKILIGSAMGSGNLDPKDRVALLESMTDEVGHLVLKNNYAQTLSLSIAESSAPKLLDMHQRVMRSFERAGELDRRLEGLPDDEEIERRRIMGGGLTRPELSVLLAYGKNVLYQTLQKSEILDAPMLQGYLMQYFPKALREKLPQEITDHQLRREIIATVITNTVINRSGVSFVIEMATLTGASPDRICMAYMTVCQIFDLPSIWRETEALDNVSSTAMQHRILSETTFTIRRTTEWLLRHVDQPMDVKACVKLYGSGLTELKSFIVDILSSESLVLVEKRTARFTDPAVPEVLSRQVGQLKSLSTVCDIVNLANRSGQVVRDTAQCYFAVSDRFALDRLRTLANRIQARDVWTAQALAAFIDDLWGLQSEISLQALQIAKGGDCLEAWAKQRAEQLQSLDLQFSELFQCRQTDVAMLTVIQRQIRMLL